MNNCKIMPTTAKNWWNNFAGWSNFLGANFLGAIIRGAFFLGAFFRAPNRKCSNLNARESYQLFRTVIIMTKQMVLWHLKFQIYLSVILEFRDGINIQWKRTKNVLTSVKRYLIAKRDKLAINILNAWIN